MLDAKNSLSAGLEYNAHPRVTDMQVFSKQTKHASTHSFLTLALLFPFAFSLFQPCLVYISLRDSITLWIARDYQLLTATPCATAEGLSDPSLWFSRQTRDASLYSPGGCHPHTAFGDTVMITQWDKEFSSSFSLVDGTAKNLLWTPSECGGLKFSSILILASC